MTDARPHRGADPRDAEAFAPSAIPRLRSAVGDLSWLLTRGYAEVSSLKLVGDRWSLTERQRNAVRRCACDDAARQRRGQHRVGPDALRGRPLMVDGFNVLTTVEAALGGAVVLAGRDGAYRDIAGVHGTYRKVEETRPALLLLGDWLVARGVGPCIWYLDSPVSNSGRLAGLIREFAEGRGWDWRPELVFDPDPILARTPEAVATADAAILDRCECWLALARAVIDDAVPGAFLVDLSPEPGVGPAD